MNDDTKFAKAHQALGQYFCEFSELERELGEAVKVVLHLEGHEAADIVVAMLNYPRNKANLVKEAAKIATTKKDGTKISTKWKTRADKTLGEILNHNESCRGHLAHSHLEPQEDGSVKVTRQSEGRRTSKVWNVKNKIDEVRRLTDRLKEIRTELSKLEVPIANLGLGHWFRAPPFDPERPPLFYLLNPPDEDEFSTHLRIVSTTKSDTLAGTK